jgi:hypothetical protein
MTPVTLLRPSSKTRAARPIEQDALAEIVISHFQKTRLPEIMIRWPNTREVISSLCNYLTDRIPSDSPSGLLINKCVERALIEWDERIGEQYTDKDRVNAFLRGLLQPLPEVLNWRIEWPAKKRRPLSIWNPYEEPLSARWMKEGCAPVVRRTHHKHKPDWTNVAESDFRSVLLTKFILTTPSIIRGKAPEFDYILGRSPQ